MLSRYDLFLKAVETGTFSETARTLGYCQSAVSQAVKTLEDELGTPLLERGKTGVRPTPDGEAYLPYIRAICGAEAALARKKEELLGLGGSRIRIGTFTAVSRNLLPALMQQFKQRYPDVEFELAQGEYSSIGQWVREGRVDFGFVNARFATGLTVEPLCDDEMMAVLPPGHPLAGRPDVGLAELADEPFILLDEGEHSVPLAAFARAGLRPRIEYRVFDDYSILAMVRQGLGVSLLYRLVLTGYGDRLAVRPLREELDRTIGLALRSWDTLPYAARRFAEFTVKRAASVLTGVPGADGGGTAPG